MRTSLQLLTLFITISLSFGSCSKSEDHIFDDCILPYEVMVIIPQKDMPKEIVDVIYGLYPTIDTVFGGVYKFCDNSKRLVVQLEDTEFDDSLMFNSCGDLIAIIKTEEDLIKKENFETKIKVHLGNNISLYDLFSINYLDGKLEYAGEVFQVNMSSNYLFDKDGKVICKLF